MAKRWGCEQDGDDNPPARVPGDIANAVWQASAAERAITCHANRHCPTRVAPYSAGDPTGVHVHEACLSSGCLDLVHELLLRVMSALERRQTSQNGGGITNLGGYVARIVGTAIVDMRREERVRRGFPAKPGRNDGAPGRVIKRLQAEPGVRGQWLPRLFRIMRQYPFSPQRVPGHWPIAGLIAEHALMSDQRVADEAEIRQDITYVTRIAADVLGAAWVHDNLTTPLACSSGVEQLQEADGVVPPATDEQCLAALVLSSYQGLLRKGVLRDDALHEAVKRVCGVDIDVTDELHDAMKELRDASTS